MTKGLPAIKWPFCLIPGCTTRLSPVDSPSDICQEHRETRASHERRLKAHKARRAEART